MLVFLSALQSKEASRDWLTVSRLCLRTLNSLHQQKDGHFRIFLVCNDEPNGLKASKHLEVLKVNLPIPEANTPSRMADKFEKLGVAAYAARSLAPAFFMNVDADDLVSNKLSEFVHSQPECHGWFFENGYIHQVGSSFVLNQPNFHMLCGTSCILKLKQADMPTSPNRAESNESLVYVGHTAIKKMMEEKGRPLLPLPFAGAMYEIGTGENDSQANNRSFYSLRKLMTAVKSTRILTQSLAREFGVHSV